MKYRVSVGAACGVALLLALGVTGCKHKQAPIANRLGPIAQQIAKPPAPVAHVAAPPAHAPAFVETERNAYVASGKTQIDTMNQSVAPAQAAAARTYGPNRAQYDKLLRDVTAKRAAFQADLAAIANANAETFPTLRAKADRDLLALRASVTAATTRIPPMRRASATQAKVATR